MMVHKNISTLFHQKYMNITLLLRTLHAFIHDVSTEPKGLLLHVRTFLYIYSCSIVFVSFDKIERYSFN